MKLILTIAAAFLSGTVMATVPHVPNEPDAPLNVVLNQLKAETGGQVLALIKFSTEPSQTKTVCQAAGRDEMTATIVYANPQSRPMEAKYILCDGSKNGTSSFALPSEPAGSNLKALSIDFNIREVEAQKTYEDNNCDVNEDRMDLICLPENYRVYNWDVKAPQNDKSRITNVAHDDVKPNCLRVDYHLEGNGYDKLGDTKINCRGHAKINAVITAIGFTTSDESLMK